jgi:sterol desaturase/sphingolipid hydroxylase (fatty acid hydroxylase superfamily)
MLDWVARHAALVIAVTYRAVALFEAVRGLARSARSTRDDASLEIVITLLLGAVIIPGVLLLVGYLGQHYLPGWAGALSGLPLWAMAVLFVVGDDMTQYWWHRASHTPLLWPLHRAHHSAPHMGARVVYRNNFFYYAMMPGLWISAALVYLGLGAVYPWYLLAKGLVLIGSHSELRWDRVLWRSRWLRPLAWLAERTISTPATHFAHHAITMDDGIGHYRGNYGNLLFFWDVLFGTAKITRRYPPQVGLKDDVDNGAERWWIQLLYPVLKSRRAQSALARQATIVG